MKKLAYLDMMEKALEAYTVDELRSLTEENRKNGVTEHGFPRIAANLGILIANGKKTELFSLWVEMMDIAVEGAHLCKTTEKEVNGKMRRNNPAGNDFFVKELVFAVMENEKNGTASPENLARWKHSLSLVEPEANYQSIARTPTQRVGNWAAYNLAGEWMRRCLGIADEMEYIEFQLGAQLYFTDEMGLYRDPAEPMLYDLATRAQFALLLHFGYNGIHAANMSEKLRVAGLFTLKMQSANGEIGFGGRSNQFLFNEAYLAACMEFEASRYQKEGNRAMASVCKRSAAIAFRSIEQYLAAAPDKHIKNRFARELRYGQEPYAYFDKYMVSLASFLYVAYLMADDYIDEGTAPVENASFVAESTPYFHKIFAASHGYSVEIDTAADFHYDATGLGRIQKAGISSALALSVPFTEEPGYFINVTEAYQNLSELRLVPDVGGQRTPNDSNPYPLAITPVVRCADGRETNLAAFSAGLTHVLNVWEESDLRAAFSVRYMHKDFVGCTYIEESYVIDESGVRVSYSADVEDGAHLAVRVPLFAFDGKEETSLSIAGARATVTYGKEVYTVGAMGAEFVLSDGFAKNRNGVYRIAEAVGNADCKLHFVLKKQ